MQTIEEIQQHAAIAHEKESRLSSRVSQARKKLDGARSAYEKVLEEARLAAEDAIFHERETPSHQQSKKTIDAQRRIEEAEAELEACLAALRRQTKAAEDLEGEVTARKHELFTRDLAPVKDKTLQLLHDFVRAAVELQKVAARHAACPEVLATTLFPWWGDGAMQDITERGAYCSLITNAVALDSYLARTYGRSV